MKVDILTRINEAIETDFYEKNDIDKLIFAAVMVGCEDKSEAFSNKVNDVLAEQRYRARRCRYDKMAMKIQGNIEYVYDPDYSKSYTASLGYEEIELPDGKGETIKVDILTRIREALEKDYHERNDIDKLIFAAYMFGVETKAKTFGNRVYKVFAEQRERASKCKYKKMAMKVQGDIKYVYDPDYSESYTASLGGEEVELPDEDKKLPVAGKTSLQEIKETVEKRKEGQSEKAVSMVCER